jgi:hypothetical protein
MILALATLFLVTSVGALFGVTFHGLGRVFTSGRNGKR